MRRALDIAVVGYGIAGIAAAIYLRRAGHRITHFERNDPPVAGGAGMLLHPAAMRQLDKLGILAAALECGARVQRIRARTEQGRSLMDFRYSDAIDGQFGLGIQRGALHRLLSGADPGHGQVLAGCGIAHVDPGTGQLEDERGKRHGPFDLIVVADGAHSLLRRQLAGHCEHGAPSAALVGLFDDPRNIAADSLTQHFVAARHLSIWPVGRASPGEPARCAIAISASLAEAETIRDPQQWRALCTRFWPGLRSLVDEGGDNASLRAITYRRSRSVNPAWTASR
jgi:2-polyprenyl-6-methoxyphenol hydroxylase-like FAD-dependent oxidoreductase